MPATTGHKMIIRNTSGVRRYFAYLGPRGTELADGADVALNGNIWEALSRKQILLDAFKNDLANGKVAIIKTTDVYMYDPTLFGNGKLRLNNGSVSITAPSEGSYAGPVSTA